MGLSFKLIAFSSLFSTSYLLGFYRRFTYIFYNNPENRINIHFFISPYIPIYGESLIYTKKVAGSEVTTSSSRDQIIWEANSPIYGDVPHHLHVLSVTQINVLPSSHLTTFKTSFDEKNGFIPMRLRTFLKLRKNHD